MDIQIKEVVLKFGKREISLSLEDAKKLYIALVELFSKSEAEGPTVIWNFPVYVYPPTDKWRPWSLPAIYSNDNQTTGGGKLSWEAK